MAENHLNSQKISQYTELFIHYDYYTRGYIHYLNVFQIITSMDIQITEKDVITLIKQTGNEDLSSIKLDQFLTLIATLIQDKGMDEQIDATFKLFDVDKNKVIDQQDIKKGFNGIGMNIAQEDIKEMLQTADGKKLSKELFHKYILEK